MPYLLLFLYFTHELHYPYKGRRQHHYQHGRHEKEYKRKEEFYRGLGGLFFRPLPALYPERIRVHPKRIGEARPPALGLYEHRGEGPQAILPGALSPIFSRPAAWVAGPRFL